MVKKKKTEDLEPSNEPTISKREQSVHSLEDMVCCVQSRGQGSPDEPTPHICKHQCNFEEKFNKEIAKALDEPMVQVKTPLV
jgi:hypothetical protein